MVALNGSIGTADLGNVDPDANDNAVDTTVGIVAAQAATGIYLQQLAGNLIVDNVAATSVTVNVRDVEFRSTTSLVTETRSLTQLNDLETTNNGPIKVRVDAGSLTINEGNDNDNIGVSAHGTGNILLRVYGAGSDIITTDDGGTNGEARITSGTGNITLRAADEISLTSQVSTGGAGTIYMVSGGNTDINRQITTATGDILLRSAANLSIDGQIVSASGDIGAIVAGNISQTANITTAGNLLLDVTGNVTMASAAETKVGTNLIIDSRGTITLGLLQATNVALNASQSILDGNDALNNVNSSNLRMVAVNGSIGAEDTGNPNSEFNANAIDITVGTVAAQAATSIYLQQTGNLIVDNVAATSVTVNVNDVQFRSTTSPVTETRSLTQLDDLETTNNGPVKVRVDAGSLTINEGNDNDNIGVRANSAGDVLLRVYGASSDIITTDDGGADGEARITSGTGHITLRAADDIALTAQVSTSGAGTIYMFADNGTAADAVAGIDINRQVTNASGDILLRSAANLSIDGPIVSASGDIGAIVAGNILQTANITTAGNLLLDVTGNVTMAPAAETKVGTNLIIDSRGTITLGLLQANNVALQASQNILDGNDALTNVRSTNLSMVATNGSIGQADAVADTEQLVGGIDLEVDTVAAQAATGIYLQEVAAGGSLVVGHVAAVSVDVQVRDVQFNSTSILTPEPRSLSALDDLETTNNGNIKIVVRNGSLTVNEGNDNDNVGVQAHGSGAILLRAIGASSDIITSDDAGPDGEARVVSGSGSILMLADDDISLTAQVKTGGVGTIDIIAANQSTVDEVGGIRINRQITSESGDITITSARDVRIDGGVQSTDAGDIRVNALNDIVVNATIQTNGAGTITLTALDRVSNPASDTRENGIYVNGRLESVDGTIKLVAGEDRLRYTSHILLNSTIQTAGTISFDATGHVEEKSNVVRVNGTNLIIVAGTFAHLHEVTVRQLTANVGGNIVGDVGLLRDWQKVNAVATSAGQKFFDKFNGLGPGTTFNANNVLTGGTALAGIPADRSKRYNLEEVFKKDYALFIRNNGDLKINSIKAGISHDAVRPNVYVETVGVNANLVVGDRPISEPGTAAADLATIRTKSSSNNEGGIVLVAGGTLTMDPNSRMITDTTVRQSVDFIGDVDDRLHGRALNAGESAFGFETTTYVLRNANRSPGPEGFIGEREQDRLVLQRVVMQFGETESEALISTLAMQITSSKNSMLVAKPAGQFKRAVVPPRSRQQVRALPLSSAGLRRLPTSFSQPTPYCQRSLSCDEPTISSFSNMPALKPPSRT